MRLFEEIIKESLMEFEPDTELGGEIGPEDNTNTWERQNSDVQFSNGKDYRPFVSISEIKPWSEEKLKEKRRELLKLLDRKKDLPNKFVKTENGRWALDLGPDNCYEIYNLPEMKKMFTEQYRWHNGEVREPSAGMVAKASMDGFFKKWIIYNMYFTDEDGDPKVRNMGDAIEYIFGKKKDRSPGADIKGAELKAYNGLKTEFVELFSLSPYEMMHYESDTDTTGEPIVGTESFTSITNKIKDKIESAVKAQTRMIYTGKVTDFMANSRSYASVRIIPSSENKTDSTAKDFVIKTQFYIPGEKPGEEVPIDRIESIYSISESQKILYARRDGEKQNFHNTIKNKIQTMFHFSTVKIEVEIEKGFSAVEGEKGRKTFFAYNSLAIHKVRNIGDLLCNFIDAINGGFMQLYFKIGDNLTFETHFKIKNSEEAWSYLYRDRKNEAMIDADQPSVTKKILAGVKYKEEDLSGRFQSAQYDNEYLNTVYDTFGQNVIRDLKLIDKVLDAKRKEKKETNDAIENGTDSALGKGRKKSTKKPAAQDQVEDNFNDNVGL